MYVSVFNNYVCLLIFSFVQGRSEALVQNFPGDLLNNFSSKNVCSS